VRPPFARVNCFFLSFVFACALPSAGLAQGSKYEGRRIATIQFVPEAQPLEPGEIKDILPLSIKGALRMADIEAAIGRLFATGRYEDIQVDAEPYGEEVIVRFVTRASQFIGNVSVAGALPDPPNRGQLLSAARLELGQPYTDEKLAQAREGIRNLLNNNGLYESSVRPEFTYDPDAQQVHIRFVVEDGRRARFGTPSLKGDFKVSAEELIGETSWRRWLIGGWKPVTHSRVRQGIDNIRLHYEKQGRLEAKVALESLDYDADTNRAIPVLEIDAGPKIEVRAIGADLSQKRIRQHVPIYQEHTVDYALLVEGARNLEEYYQSRGYFQAEIEPKQQRVTNDRATIDYLINVGRRHRLVHVEVAGNRYFTTGTIRERMFLQPASLLQFRHGRYSERLLRRDEDEIVELYRSNGFRDAAVRSRIVDDYRGKSGDIAVFLTIEEGPQWFVSRLEVEGIGSLEADEIRGMLSSSEGQPFSEYNVGIDRDTILGEYFARGFPNATFEWSYRPSEEPQRMELRFAIDEGRQQFVRQVLISGLDATSQSLVARNILLNPGDPLSPHRLTETQRRLYDLGVFAKVDTAIQNPDGETDRKFVLYDMEEARRWSITTGFGAEVAKIGGCRRCLESPAGQAGFAPRVSFNVARQNMWGLAHTLSFRSRVSTLERRGLVNYSAPRFRNIEGLNLLFTGLYDQSFNVRTFAAQRFEGAAQLSQRVSKATTMFYRYTYRRVSVDSDSIKIAPLLIPLLTQPVRVGILSGSMVVDRRDDPVEPRKGIYNTLDLGVAEGVFGSQPSFVRFLGRNATYHPVGRRMVLARNTTLGTLHPFNYSGDAEQAVPLAERFFSGGGASHRGFPELQAGPRDLVTGFPLGGSALLFNQTELRLPLVGENVSGVLFHDAGNVYTRLRDVSFRVTQRDLQDFNYMVHAAGFGIRYRTPVGPIRVDLAYGLNPPRFFGFDTRATQQELIDAGVDPCRTQPDRCVVQRISRFQFSFSIGQTF
jgi:outer membrane protein insertion porin family